MLINNLIRYISKFAFQKIGLCFEIVFENNFLSKKKNTFNTLLIEQAILRINFRYFELFFV